MLRVVILIGLAILLFFALRWLSRQPSRVYWQTIAVGTAAVLLVLVATGRAHWLTAIFAALLPFVRGILALLSNLPLIKQVFGGIKGASGSGGGQTSTVQSKFIRMTLNHDSGDIDGEILEGQFKGRTLDQLELDQLLQLLKECQDDEESVALLQSYLDREHGDTWQQQAGERAQQQASSNPGSMSREEALQILGLSTDASEKEIIQAHRRLMQNLHPDRGGSAYLATKINLAKDTLLDTKD